MSPKNPSPYPDPTFALESARLRITHFDATKDTHCDFLIELYNSPGFVASRNGQPSSITTREAARRRLQTRFVDEFARNGYGTFLVSLRGNSGAEEKGGEKDDAVGGDETNETHIGTISLSKGATSPYLAPDIGFGILSPTHTRKGYATEAAQRLLSYYSGPVFGFCDVDNVASLGVFAKLGFRDEGVWGLSGFGDGEVRGRVWSWGMHGGDGDGDGRVGGVGVWGLK